MARRYLRWLLWVSWALLGVAVVGLSVDEARDRSALRDFEALEETLLERGERDRGVFEELEWVREVRARESLEVQIRRRRFALLATVAAALVLIVASRLRAEPTLPTLEEIRRARPASAAALSLTGINTEDPPEPDPALVAEMVERHGSAPDAAIPILLDMQSRWGFLPEVALRRLCEISELTPAQVAGVATFYAELRLEPCGRHRVRVCHGTACHVAGAREITDELRRAFELPPDGDTDPNRLFTLDPVPCLGCCSLAPVMRIDEGTAGHLDPALACETLRQIARGAA